MSNKPEVFGERSGEPARALPQGPPADAVPVPAPLDKEARVPAREGVPLPDEEPPSEGEEIVVTETVAELYAQQGLVREAARLYRKLLQDDPSNRHLGERLQALEERRKAMILGIDVGRSGLKAVGESRRLFLLPVFSRVRRLPPQPRRVVDDGRLLRLKLLHLRYEGEDWLLGEEAEIPGGGAFYRMDLLKTDAYTRLLVLAGATQLTAAPRVEVCVGVPVAFYDQHAPLLRTLLDQVHTVTIGRETRELELHGVVVPEGLGLLVAASALQGAPDLTFFAEPHVVLDFGHRITQAIAFQGVTTSLRAVTLYSAAWEVFDAVLREEIETPAGTLFEEPQKARMVEKLLFEGSLRVRGRQYRWADVEPRLKEEAQRRWPRLREEIQRALVGLDYVRVIAGGGGVHLFAQGLRELFRPEELILLEDRYAQAEGYRLFLAHQELGEAGG